MMYFLFILSGCAAAFISAVSLRIAFLLLKKRTSDYTRLQSRYASWKDPFIGRARIEHDRIPDGVVQAGLVFNKDTGRFEPNGRISEEALDRFMYG
jgi:hypothetical protein